MINKFLVNARGEKLSEYMKAEVKKDITTVKKIIWYFPFVTFIIVIFVAIIYAYIKLT